MCHFITATLPKNAELDKVKAIFEKHKLGFTEIENPQISAQIEKGDRYILTTRGMCDCGTVLGSLKRSVNACVGDESKSYDYSIKKLKKKGWSDAKIQRWIQQSALEDEKRDRKLEAAAKESVSSAQDWVDFISDVLTLKAADRIGILVHDYRGGISSERIKLSRKESVTINQLSSRYLTELDEDVIYEFTL